MKMGEPVTRRRNRVPAEDGHTPRRTGGNTPPTTVSRNVRTGGNTPASRVVSRAAARTGGNTPATQAPARNTGVVPPHMRTASRTLSNLGSRVKKPRKGY